jgi:peptide/nickel transport system permease protein
MTPGRMALRRFARSRLSVAGAVIVLALVLMALLAPRLAPFSPTAQDYGSVLKAPSPAHLLGTDDLGRDELSRTIYGARISLEAGVLSVGLALVIGVPVGLAAGYLRGPVDEVIMRITDAMLAFPFVVLALALAGVLGPGFTHAMIAIGIGFTPGFVRLTRGQVLAEREKDYVAAAEASGGGIRRILFGHILANILAPILVQAALTMSFAIIAEAGLSYLGLGVQPPTPSWGSMLHTAQGYLETAPWMAYWPGLGIFLAVLGFNLMADGLRDALDVKQQL